MAVASGVASYSSSSAVILLVQGALAEHGVTLGQNTATLMVLVVGAVAHYGYEAWAVFQANRKGSGNVNSSQVIRPPAEQPVVG